MKHHLANARSKVGAETTAQLVWILAPRVPEPEARPRRMNSGLLDLRWMPVWFLRAPIDSREDETSACALLTAPADAPILNQMVHYSPVDRTFAALADPTRRAVLERLGQGSATISELAEPFGMSLTGMKKHVRVLEEAQLASTVKVGRTRLCSRGPRRLDDVREWVDLYRQMVNEQLDRFGDLLDRTKGESR